MNSNWVKYIIIGFLLFLLYSNFYLNNYQNYSLMACTSIGLYSIIQYLYMLISWKKCGGELMSAYIIFMTAFYLFNQGQVFLDYFGAEYDSHLLLNGYLDQQEYFDAAYISLGSLLFFHFGGLLSIKKNISEKKLDKIKLTRIYNSIYAISILFCVISLPFYFYNFFSRLGVVILYGYDALYDPRFSTSQIITFISNFYPTSLICLYFAEEFLNKHKWFVLSMLFFTIFLPPILLGGRSNAGIIAGIILIIYSLYHKITKKQLMIIAVSAFSVILVFNFVGSTRNVTNKSSVSLIESIQGDENPLISFLAETGFSMYPLGETTSLVPENRDFEYGSTYLWEMTSLIPNLGFWKLHPAQVNDPSVWLQDMSGHTFGVGYSLIAEAYHNFGYFCFIFMIFNGLIYSFFLSKINRSLLFENPLLVVLAIMFFWASIKGVRNSFQGVIRGFFYYSFIPFYFMVLYYKIKYRSKKYII